MILSKWKCLQNFGTLSGENESHAGVSNFRLAKDGPLPQASVGFNHLNPCVGIREKTVEYA